MVEFAFLFLLAGFITKGLLSIGICPLRRPAVNLKSFSGLRLNGHRHERYTPSAFWPMG